MAPQFSHLYLVKYSIKIVCPGQNVLGHYLNYFSDYSIASKFYQPE